MAHKIIKEVGVMLAIIGVAGAVFFFPVKMDNGKTCLAQQYFALEENGKRYSTMENGHDMAQNYIIPYGFIWWTSLGMLILGLYLTRYKKERQAVLSSGTESKGQKLLSV